MGRFTVTYNPDVLTLKITRAAGYQIKLWTDNELLDPNLSWLGDSYNADTLNSVNDIITNTAVNEAEIVYTGLIDLRRYSHLYITSPNLSAFCTMGPRGECSILKKVPVNADYGSIIFDNVQSTHDYCNVSKMLIKTIEFRITDPYGNDIDLRGKSVSWSMAFVPDVD